MLNIRSDCAAPIDGLPVEAGETYVRAPTFRVNNMPKASAGMTEAERFAHYQKIGGAIPRIR